MSYTVPVQAKKLIENFEKGKIAKKNDEEEEEITKRQSHPEMAANELAQPGTAKKILMEFETKNQAASNPPPMIVRNSSFTIGTADENGTEKVDMVETNEHEIQTVSNADDHHQLEEEMPAAAAAVEEELHRKEVKVEVEVVHHVVQEHAAAPPPPVNHVEVRQVKDHAAVVDRVDGVHAKERVLIVSAAAGNDLAFNKALLDDTIRIFQENKNEVLVTDLNKLKGGGSKVDYSLERKKLLDANLIIFHYHSVLHSAPAELVEWFQNVLIEKFAFDTEYNRIFEHGLLRGKRSLLLVTMGHDSALFGEGSPCGDVSLYLWPIQNGILRFVGFDVLSPQVIYGVRANVKNMNPSSDWMSRLREIGHEKPMWSN